MDEVLPRFTIGLPRGEHLSVTALYRHHNDAQDYWDGNWIESEVELKVGGFKAKYQASLRVDEIDSFLSALIHLYENLSDRAEFSSLEEWLSIRIKGDGIGRFTAECYARDEAGIGNKLQFVLGFDQTDIAAIASGLRSIMNKFPIRGSRDA